MKKKIRLSSVWHFVCILLFPAVMSSCLYEHTEETVDGEMGVDPTAVNVAAELTLDMNISDIEIKSRAAGDHTYRHRFIIDAYLDKKLASRQVIYKDLSDDSRKTIPVSMKLHARNYQLVVWTDYVKADSEDDLYYQTSDLAKIISTEPYQGNSNYRDVFYGNTELDLTEYRKQWNAKVPVKIEMTRPMARYELKANDVEKFLQRIADGKVTDQKFRATVKYEYYLPVGFNALEGTAAHALMYMQYNKTFAVPAKGTEDFVIGFDYLFVNGPGSFVTLTVEIADEKGTKVYARISGLKVAYEQNKTTIVKGNFLTADPNTGVDFETEFDEELDVDLDKPKN